jgi:hypothetical protein
LVPKYESSTTIARTLSTYDGGEEGKNFQGKNRINLILSRFGGGVKRGFIYYNLLREETDPGMPFDLFSTVAFSKFL